MIDPGDAIYSSLRLWIDENHDGICQPEELFGFGTMAMPMGPSTSTMAADSTACWVEQGSRKQDQYGNIFRYRAAVDPDEPDHSGRKPGACAGVSRKISEFDSLRFRGSER
jgi:hypothetical protein